MSLKTQESREDYLERILMLSEKNGFVRAIDIANDMNFSKPSISIALKKLKNDNLINIDENTNYITLTSEGKEIAVKVYERHQIISSILIRIGVPSDVALEDACRLEHDLSEISFDKIREAYNKMK